MNPVTFFVAGVPIPQGSKTGYSRKNSTFVQLVDANKDVLKPWRAEVARVAEASWADRPQLVDAVRMDLIFVMPRGKTVSRRFPSVKPDIDKLLRAVCDGITTSGVWKDDAQVVKVGMEEVYGAVPGVHVTVQELSADGPLTRGERWLAEMGTRR